MMYIVHIVQGQKVRSFQTHKPAFQAFKAATKQGFTVALWHSTSRGKWTRVHSVGLYPTALTQPPNALYDSNRGVA